MRPNEMDAASAVSPWLNGRFSMRSGYYAGRGPSTGDLNSSILEMFYQGIKKDIGKAEARNFVRFVNKLKDLSASAFIVAFERFWASGLKTIDEPQQPGDGVRLSGRGNELLAEGLGAIASAFGRRKNPQDDEMTSLSIKREFIQNHQKEIPDEERVAATHRSQNYTSPW